MGREVKRMNTISIEGICKINTDKYSSFVHININDSICLEMWNRDAEILEEELENCFHGKTFGDYIWEMEKKIEELEEEIESLRTKTNYLPYREI